MPIETLAVTRVIEIMINHVRGSQRKEAQVGDLLAAILEEDKAFCSKLLHNQGITRLNIFEYITEHAIKKLFSKIKQPLVISFTVTEAQAELSGSIVDTNHQYPQSTYDSVKAMGTLSKTLSA